MLCAFKKYAASKFRKKLSVTEAMTSIIYAKNSTMTDVKVLNLAGSVTEGRLKKISTDRRSELHLQRSKNMIAETTILYSTANSP